MWFCSLHCCYDFLDSRKKENKKEAGQASCFCIEHVGQWHSFLGKIVAQRYGFSDSTKKSGG